MSTVRRGVVKMGVVSVRCQEGVWLVVSASLLLLTFSPVVENEGLKKNNAWFVDSVTVADEKGNKWLCPCNQWLSLFHTDCQVLCKSTPP